jgi:hypothetical protein
MTRTLSKILILVLMVVVFFAPVSASFEKKDNQIAFNVEVSKVDAQTKTNDWTASKFSCGFFQNAGLTGCFSWFVYYFLYTPISFFASLAAQFLDYFIYYSTNSTSYSSNFVGVAWGAVRDIANIFFIIGLLYVAIETILGIGHNGKKMIASIVVVALLINFSLFFTQVVIDTSNILARVFYNNIDAINKDKSLAIGSSGEKSITTALVSMFDPQDIVSPTQYASNDYDGGPGAFITITLLATIVSAIMLWVFLATALMFVARVAGLYISMIFAPIAFASYTVPFDIEGLGHKQWWTTLLKQAFLAPIFIFFLYVILLFRDAFKTIFGDVKISTDAVSWSEGHINGLLKVIIPFAIVTVLLLRAKKLAVEYSGTIGESFSKAGSFIAGAATGGIIGAYATIGRGTIGRLGNTISKSSTLNTLSKNKTFGFVGRGLTNASKFVATSSFDARGTGLVSGVGQAAKGGYVGDIKKRTNTRLERLENIKEGANKDLKGKLKTNEEELKQLELDTHKELAEIDEAMKAIREQQNDVSKMPAGPEKTKMTEIYSDKLKLFKTKKEKLQKGEKFDGGKYYDDDGVTEKTLDGVDYVKKYGGRSLSTIKKGISELKHNIEHSEINIGLKFIKNHESSTQLGEAYDFITARNVVNKDAKNKIRMDMKPSKEEKGGGDHGGGSHGGGSHAPKPAASKPAAAAGGSHGGGHH